MPSSWRRRRHRTGPPRLPHHGHSRVMPVTRRRSRDPHGTARGVGSERSGGGAAARGIDMGSERRTERVAAQPAHIGRRRLSHARCAGHGAAARAEPIVERRRRCSGSAALWQRQRSAARDRSADAQEQWRRWRLGLPCLAPSAPGPVEGGADPRCLLAGAPALGLVGGSPALLDLLRRRRAGLRLRTACFCSSEQGGGEQRRQAGRIEETRERKGIERRKREGVTKKWAPPPRGVHVSKTALQNCWMTKCERF